MFKKTLPITLVLLLLLMNILATIPVVKSKPHYRVPITITERSGNNLYNYTIRIELNSTNFEGWEHVSEDGSDIYFTDVAGVPLYYWIEEFNSTNKHALLFVKVPSIPASGSVKIYMYYGATNLYPEYNNATMLNIITKKMFAEKLGAYDYTGINDRNITLLGDGIYLVVSVYGSESYARFDGNNHFSVYQYVYSNPYGHALQEWFVNRTVYAIDIKYNNSYVYTPGEYRVASIYLYVLQPNQTHYILELKGEHAPNRPDVLVLLPNGTKYEIPPNTNINLPDLTRYRLNLEGICACFSIYAGIDNMYYGAKASVDLLELVFYLQPRADPEPDVLIGSEELASAIHLPSETIYLVHDIVYSPNSTQFTHNFTTTNTTTAGYETSYSDIYGWRVYANPYQSGGTNYENNASLVSEVNITLPYSETLVKNITLLARTNGTGDFRQLWIKVLDSNGNVIAELTNATISTEWTEVSLSVNANLGGQITIWINATVKSTTTTGEEIAVKDVRIYVEHETNPIVEVPISYNVDFFNCSASHYVRLGSSEYLNSSVIIFKLIEFLIYNTTDYPASPAYIGNETINSYNYMVYKIDSASYSQYLTVYALLENKLKTFRTHIRGYDTETVLVGEQLTIDLPELGNITIPELNKTFINVTSVTIKPTSEGIYTIEANLTQPTLWKIGCCAKRITVQYGTFSVKPIDVDSKVVDYESVTLQLINKSDESIIKEVTGIQTISLNNLWAGNYSIVIKFKDITIGMKDFELNITTNNSTISMPCTMKILTKDYRGLNKTIIYEYDKQVISIENLSVKYPYSRIRILLNGTGSFKLYIDYRGDLPTKVDITSNATNLKYYWDGNYLVIEGELGSSAEITVEDQYKLAIIFLDKLNNPIPSKVDINGTEYKGNSVTLYLPPATYKLSFVQFNDKGFKIANNTLAYVEINNSDKVLHVYYKVPVKFEKVEIKKTEETNTTATIMISGYLLDYYNSGVSNKTVNIIITNLGTGASTTYNTTTDVSGYFTMTIKLIKGYDYKVEISASEDDTYVLSKAYATSVSLKEVTAPARKVSLPVLLLIMIGVVIITIIAVIVVTKKVKKALMLKPRKYVKIRK